MSQIQGDVPASSARCVGFARASHRPRGGFVRRTLNARGGVSGAATRQGVRTRPWPRNIRPSLHHDAWRSLSPHAGDAGSRPRAPSRATGRVRAGRKERSRCTGCSPTEGLAALRAPLPTEALFDWQRMTEALAAETPGWEPGSRSGYHAMTYGFLVGEVLRRVDGRTLGAFFQGEVAEPLGADFWIGLPAAEDVRVAEMVPPSAEAVAAAGAAQPAPDSLLAKVMGNPPLAPTAANCRLVARRSGHRTGTSTRALRRRVMARRLCGTLGERLPPRRRSRAQPRSRARQTSCSLPVRWCQASCCERCAAAGLSAAPSARRLGGRSASPTRPTRLLGLRDDQMGPPAARWRHPRLRSGEAPTRVVAATRWTGYSRLALRTARGRGGAEETIEDCALEPDLAHTPCVADPAGLRRVTRH